MAGLHSFRHAHLLHDLGEYSVGVRIDGALGGLLKLFGTLFLIKVINDGGQHTANNCRV